MQAEYLLFHLAVFSGPFVLSFLRPTYFRPRFPLAFLAIAIPAPVYLVWDALVTDRHWWFHPKFCFPFRFAGLPFEEILFFFTVPFACIFTWEILLKPKGDEPRSLRLLEVATTLRALAPLGIALFLLGKEYTGLVFVFLSLGAWLDHVLRTHLLLLPRFYGLLLLVLAFTGLFNGYLTARPVVLYDPAYQIGFRLGTIPLEDFGYGLSLSIFNVVLYETFKRWDASFPPPPLPSRPSVL